MARVFRNYARFDIQLFLECANKFSSRYCVRIIFKALAKSVMLDGISPANIDEHDKIFVPKNEYEKEFWESCRELAKEDIKKVTNSMENGKKGGRPPKKEEEKIIQEPIKQEIRGAFVTPTEEEVVNYAKQMCELPPVMGGFQCSKDMVVEFFNHYDRQGWILGNGVHMTNWKSALKKWCTENVKKMN
jgi:hypothetical protein